MIGFPYLRLNRLRNLKITNLLDVSSGKALVEDGDTSEPTGESDGYVGVAIVDGTARIYFAVGGTMYYVDGTTTVAVPIADGMSIGRLLALTYKT